MIWRGDNFEIAKIYWRYLKNLLKNYWAKFKQTWHKASLGDGDSNLFKWRPTPFSKGDNYEIVKIHLPNLKIFFSRTIWPISTKLDTKHPRVKGNQGFTNIKDLSIVKKEMMGFYSLNQHYDIVIALVKCVDWFELVSQVSDVAHGPLVKLKFIHWIYKRNFNS